MPESPGPVAPIGADIALDPFHFLGIEGYLLSRSAVDRWELRRRGEAAPIAVYGSLVEGVRGLCSSARPSETFSALVAVFLEAHRAVIRDAQVLAAAAPWANLPLQ